VDGEIPGEDLGELVPEIQRAADGHGNASQLGHTLTWNSGTGGDAERTLQVTVTSRDGQTRIRIEERLHGMAGALFGGIVAGGGTGLGLGVGLGVGLGALGSAAFATLFPVGAIGGCYLLARSIFAAVSKRRRRVLLQLLDRITEYVMSLAPPTPLSEDPPRGQLPSG
jgi:hypothetical protein